MTQQINLLNPEFRRSSGGPDSKALLRVLGGIAAGCALVAAFAHWQAASLGSRVKDIERLVAGERAKLANLAREAGPRPRSKVLDEEVARTEALVEARREVMQALDKGTLGNTTGYSGHMRAFARQAVTGLWLTGFSIESGGRDLGLSGRALRAELVPAYLRGLNQEDALRGAPFAAVSLTRPVAETGKGKAAPAWLEFRLQSAEFKPEQSR